MKYFLLLLFISASLLSFGQHQDSSTVNIHADPRLAAIVNKPSSSRAGFVGKVRGYRVQIYNGNDRKLASQAKLDFMRHFPGLRSYLTYNNPQFRVRVGDFVSRKDALELLNKVSSKFNPSMVVPDVVNVNTTKSKNKETKENESEEDD
jgi:hypothetical protein